MAADFKVGDWVRYVGKHPTHPQLSMLGLVGKVKEVTEDDFGTVDVDWIYTALGNSGTSEGEFCTGVYPQNIEKLEGFDESR